MKKQNNKLDGETSGVRSRGIVRVACWSVLAAALTASALAQSVPGKPASKVIRGEPIDAGNSSAPGPASDVKASVAAPQTNGVVNPSPIGTPALSSAAAPPPSTGTTNGTPAASEAVKSGGYLSVGFDKLASYEFDAPDVQVTNVTHGIDEADKFIPPAVKGLDGKKAVIKGFMLPLKVEAGKTTEFLIMRNQSACCFGVPPKITELVMVKTSGKGVDPIMDQPVNIEGTLHVGTERENGFIVGIYRMDGEKMIGD